MSNQEFFDYLNILGRIPNDIDKPKYELIIKNDINIVEYYKVYSKIQPGIEYGMGINRMLESLNILLGKIHSQKDFDTFVNGFDNILKMYFSYDKREKFIRIIESNYIGILWHVFDGLGSIDKLLLALRLITNPTHVLYNGEIYICDCTDTAPRAHFELLKGLKQEKIENVMIVTYKDNKSKISKIWKTSDYSKKLEQLGLKFKNNEIDFAVCAYTYRNGDLASFHNKVFKYCED